MVAILSGQVIGVLYKMPWDSLVGPRTAREWTELCIDDNFQGLLFGVVSWAVYEMYELNKPKGGNMNKKELESKIQELAGEMQERASFLVQNDPLWANKAGMQAAYSEMLEKLEADKPKPKTPAPKDGK